MLKQINSLFHKEDNYNFQKVLSNSWPYFRKTKLVDLEKM